MTSGGRVLGVTAAGDTLEAALKDAYAAANRIGFEGKYLRHELLPLFIAAGIAAGGQNDAGGGAAVPLDRHVPQGFVLHLRLEAQGLLTELRTILGVSSLTGLRLVNRYDVENLSEEVFQRAKSIVFSEPQVDLIYEESFPLPADPFSAGGGPPGSPGRRSGSCIR